MGIAQQQERREEAEAEQWQRFIHDMVWFNCPGKTCPCSECEMKRSLPMNQKQTGGS